MKVKEVMMGTPYALRGGPFYFCFGAVSSACR